jgi:fermentation-respiration switch protein FrsA (DUF1100 family)
MQIFRKIMLFALIFYLLLLAMLFIFQRKLQYLPSGEISAIPAGFQEKILITNDGEKILAWFKAPKKNQKIILYFHGNAGNLGNRSEKFQTFANAGFGVMAISYRGYFGSSGAPSQDGLILDAKAAFQYLLDLEYLPKDIILFGESLGSGVASQLAAKFDFAALILEAPYSSITSVAQKTYWFVPVSLILKDKFESIKIAKKISSPVLIIHGNKDLVVAIDEGKKLFAEISAPKQFIEVDGAGHLEFSNEFLLEKLRNFVAKN